MNRITVNRDKFKVDDIELIHGELTIGRENDNDLHFDHPYLSGHHAKIITLFDASHVEDLDSTNGTYVTLQDDRIVFLRRESLPLWGGGQIALGAPADEGVDHTVDYRCG